MVHYSISMTASELGRQAVVSFLPYLWSTLPWHYDTITLKHIECALQILGAMCGSALVAALTPSDIYVGMGDGAPGCFDAKTASSEITKSQVFGWEVSRIRSMTELKGMGYHHPPAPSPPNPMTGGQGVQFATCTSCCLRYRQTHLSVCISTQMDSDIAARILCWVKM